MEFVAKYNKMTGNENEIKQRFGIFKSNLNRIKEHNKLYEAGIAPFDMEVNQFTDLSEAEFIQMYASGIRKP